MRFLIPLILLSTVARADPPAKAHALTQLEATQLDRAVAYLRANAAEVALLQIRMREIEASNRSYNEEAERLCKAAGSDLGALLMGRVHVDFKAGTVK